MKIITNFSKTNKADVTTELISKRDPNSNSNEAVSQPAITTVVNDGLVRISMLQIDVCL
jgi:hypothetical protein